MMNHASSSGVRQELTAISEQPARGNSVTKSHHSLAGVFHLEHLGTPWPKLLDDGAEKFLRYVDHELFVRLESLAVCADPGDDTRTRHLKLVPFTPHRLHENREMQLSTARHGPGIGRIGVLDAQGHVTLELPIQSLADLARCHELSVAPGER